MAETIGNLVDKICIAELKLYHMEEQVARADATAAHRQTCRDRWSILNRQRAALVQELNDTMARWRQGRWRPIVYRQFKMYNDPRFRIAPKTESSASR